MNKKLLIFITLSVLVFIPVIAGLVIFFISKKSDNKDSSKESTENEQTTQNPEEDAVYKYDDTPTAFWVKPMEDGKVGPWELNLYMSVSKDGIEFTDEKLFLSHAGVVNLLLASNGDLIATFQYFSNKNQNLFDVICYTISKDNGTTWSAVKKIKFTGFANPIDKLEGSKPVDPTLVQLADGSFRLYFTYQSPGVDVFPQLYSAKSATIDGIFTNEGKQLTTSETILDPAVVFFNNKWHHYTIKQEEENSGQTINVHSVSDTGLNFTRKDDIPLDMRMLGNVIVDGTKLKFYGSGDGGVVSATSTDGYKWTVDSGNPAQGADPGIAKLKDGSYIMIYTTFGE